MFPKIETIQDFQPKIDGNKQIRVKTVESGIAAGFTVICYMVQDEDTFAGSNQEFEKECRGIVFGPGGQLAARTMQKFFNIGEKPETMPENIKWQDVVRIMMKVDGSMVTPVAISNEQFKFKTKKSFDTPEAALADSITAKIDVDTNGAASKFIWDCVSKGLTPTFEVTSPRFPIVVHYRTDELTLLHVRENVSGRYFSEEEILKMNSPFKLVENKIADFYNDGIPANIVSWEKLKKAAETMEGIEGWVLQFKNGDMVKMKTAWYINLHHAITFVRYRDVARAILTDTADDLKAAFNLLKRDVTPILNIEGVIKTVVSEIESAVMIAVNEGKQLNFTAKDMALKYKVHKHFGLIMNQFNGKENNFYEYYLKNYINDWTLEVIPTTVNEE
jgi:RNA ligase